MLIFTLMLRKTLIVSLITLLYTLNPVHAQESFSLQGEWAFRLDPEGEGIYEQWFMKALPDKVSSPGSLDEQGIGDPVEEIHMGKLTSETRYVGSAWYQKEVEIPEEWKERRIVIFLERAYWETTVYVDGVHTPVLNSLSTPHIHDLTQLLSPGKHRITIHVDNSVKINIGHTFGNMLWPHALSEETQTNWNGIIGKIELISTPSVWINEVQAYPDFDKKVTRIKAVIGNMTGGPVKGSIDLSLLPDGHSISVPRFYLAGKDTTIEVNLPFEEDPRYWDEFNPELYELSVILNTGEGKHNKSLKIGLRDFRAVDQHFEINGRHTFLRGKVCSAVFPLTGYPPMDASRWHEIFSIYQDYGINHVRFHSWCPPEAAFKTADELGMILQVEPPLWDGYGKVGSIPERAAYILEETGRIVDTYGNHPSFCLMSLGNELGDGKDPYLAYLIDYLKKKDSRHLYTSTTHPAGMERKDDYFNAAGTKKGTCRGISPFTDYRDILADLKRPLISHELGQPAMYPNYSEIEKYTGHLKPEYLKIFRKSLEDHHMPDQSPDFYKASGALLVEIYKENIEAQLRTPNMAGFQLLDIQDYPGHGLASIGILDAFLDSKGLITPAEFRRFCSETVPLIRMPGFVYTNDQVLTASAEVAHFGSSNLQNQQVHWKIQNSKGKTEFEGTFPNQDILTGTNTMLGDFEADLSHIRKADQLTIEVSIPGTEIINSWKCWVYPKEGMPEIPEDIYLTSEYNEEAREILLDGGKVLLIPVQETLEHIESARWDPVFWSYQLFKQPKVMGILCDPDHPALKEFPTDYHSDWQWKNLLDQSEALIIDNTPQDFRPIIQFVPDFNSNHKLSALMEARVGNGALMVCNIDLLNNSKYPASVNQLLKSILNHMQSKQFMSAPHLDIDLVDELLEVTPEMAQSGQLVFDARSMEGPNVAVHRLLLLPE